MALSLALGAWLQHIGVAAAIVLVELFVACAMVATLRRRSLEPWSEVVEEAAA